ncbi:hypothetical protein D3C85_1692110 [compost metagenome]
MPSAVAINRSPFAFGCVIAFKCKSTTSRTSMIPNEKLGLFTIFPSIKSFIRLIESEKSLFSGGPKIPTGLTTLNSKFPPSFFMKFQAANSAKVFDLM